MLSTMDSLNERRKYLESLANENDERYWSLTRSGQTTENNEELCTLNDRFFGINEELEEIYSTFERVMGVVVIRPE